MTQCVLEAGASNPGDGAPLPTAHISVDMEPLQILVLRLSPEKPRFHNDYDYFHILFHISTYWGSHLLVTSDWFRLFVW